MAKEKRTLATASTPGECVLCRHPVEAWPGTGNGGYGHNPDPFWRGPSDSGRACNWCNEHLVIPARLRLAQRRRMGKAVND